MQTRVLFGIIGALMCMSTATASVIEVPGANEEMSGIYFFAGWKCAQGALSGRIDGGAVFPLAGLIDRPDTVSVCNDTNNGWIAQYNFNRLAQGTHTFQAFDGAASFASVTFQVVHFGWEFKTGMTGSGTSTLSDGSTATLTWRQSLQAFVVTEATPGPVIPTPGPVIPTPDPGFPNVAGTWATSLSFLTEDCNFIEIPPDLPTQLGGTLSVSQNGSALTVLSGSSTFTGDLEMNGDFVLVGEASVSTVESCTFALIAGFAGNFLDESLVFLILADRVSGSCAGLSLPCFIGYSGSVERISAVSLDEPGPDPVRDVLDAMVDALRSE